MPEPTAARRSALIVQSSPPLDEDTSDSEDMEAELRIVDAPSAEQRSSSETEADQASTDNDSSPQDLRVRPPSPITLASSPRATGKPRSPASLVPPDLPASRKRKSSPPTPDRRAKWLLGNGDPLRPMPPLSPAVNGRARGSEEPAAFPLPSSLAAPTCSSENATPLMSPAAQGTETGSGCPEEEDLAALLQDLGRSEEQLRVDLQEASARHCKRVEASVRQAMAGLQARHLTTLSAAAAAAAAASQAGPLPPLSDINGNAALLSMKEVSKNVEQLMLASQCLPYRFMAAGSRPLPYPPISGLLPAPMPLAFPLPGTGACDSPGGATGADSDDAEGEGLPLNMSKKKRTKVTDSHLRAFTGLDMAAVLPGALENLGIFNNMTAVTVTAPPPPPPPPPPLASTPSVSLTSSPLRGPSTSFADLSSTTLTPVHLRKAKLMFFYSRYPNSNVLKVYFPDVQFNKHNTAQIVKWFSNFREFYYIQIEKFARQAIAEGAQEADEITIMAECELIRTLNTHYNRNNQIPVPHHFITVVEMTVREFFKALMSHKDQDHSWKKPIYKVIARYDQPVPDDFKTSTWIDHMDS